MSLEVARVHENQIPIGICRLFIPAGRKQEAAVAVDCTPVPRLRVDRFLQLLFRKFEILLTVINACQPPHSVNVSVIDSQCFVVCGFRLGNSPCAAIEIPQRRINDVQIRVGYDRGRTCPLGQINESDVSLHFEAAHVCFAQACVRSRVFGIDLK